MHVLVAVRHALAWHTPDTQVAGGPGCLARRRQQIPPTLVSFEDLERYTRPIDRCVPLPGRDTRLGAPVRVADPRRRGHARARNYEIAQGQIVVVGNCDQDEVLPRVRAANLRLPADRPAHATHRPTASSFDLDFDLPPRAAKRIDRENVGPFDAVPCQRRCPSAPRQLRRDVVLPDSLGLLRVSHADAPRVSNSGFGDHRPPARRSSTQVTILVHYELPRTLVISVVHDLA